MTDSTTKRRSAAKPRKPCKDFPLFVHQTDRWAKKIRGRLVYFGKASTDPQGVAALELWLAQKDELLAGRKPKAKEDAGKSVADVCDLYLVAKEGMAETGELSRVTFRDAYAACERVVKAFGKNRPVADLGPADFLRLKAKMATTLGLPALAAEIARIRAIFNWAAHEDNRHIEQPVRFGREFKPATRKALTKARQTNGNARRKFEREEILAMLDAAPMPLRAMLLLGINCGFGNSDCATLTLDALDLDGGWVNHPRPKTGAERRCALWAETVTALREAIANRPKPKDPKNARLVFLTWRGNAWARLVKKRGSDNWADSAWKDSISPQTAELLKGLGLRRDGRGFYSLRHVFESVAGESADQVAVNHVMGHVDASMADTYRERVGTTARGISDSRLRAVSDHVHGWLFGGHDNGR